MDRDAFRAIMSIVVLLLLVNSNSLGATEPDRGISGGRSGQPVRLAPTEPETAPPASTPESPEIQPPFFSWIPLLFGDPGPKQSTGLTVSPPAGAFVLTALERRKLDLAREACAKASARPGQTELERRLSQSTKADAVNLPTAAEIRPDSAAMVGVSLPPRQEIGPPGLSDAEREKLRALANSPAPNQKEVQP